MSTFLVHSHLLQDLVQYLNVRRERFSNETKLKLTSLAEILIHNIGQLLDHGCFLVEEPAFPLMEASRISIAIFNCGQIAHELNISGLSTDNMQILLSSLLRFLQAQVEPFVEHIGLSMEGIRLLVGAEKNMVPDVKQII